MKQKNYYILLFIAIILSFTALVLNISYHFKIQNVDEIVVKNYLNLLIVVVGIIIGLSIIGLYSIYNSSIDYLRNDVEKNVKKIEDLNRESKNILTRLKFNDELPINTLYLFVLTSEHTPDYYKLSAVIHFTTSIKEDKNCINENMKGTIRNYYESLVIGNMTPSYFDQLEKLVGAL
ncbi:MAG: hypothetical protein HOO91_04030 [Bacteroidales bacterium]|nr:hypothetical protein [Bacteroidales bacterium]